LRYLTFNNGGFSMRDVLL